MSVKTVAKAKNKGKSQPTNAQLKKLATNKKK